MVNGRHFSPSVHAVYTVDIHPPATLSMTARTAVTPRGGVYVVRIVLQRVVCALHRWAAGDLEGR